MIAILGRVSRGFLGATIYGIGLVTLVFSDPNEPVRGTIALVLLALQVLRVVLRGYSDSLTIVFSVTTILLYAIPGSAIVLLLGLDVLPTVLAYIVFIDVMLTALRKDKLQGQQPLRRSIAWSRNRLLTFTFLLLLVWCAIAGFLFDSEGFLGLLLFVVPFSVSVVVFERLLAHKASLTVIVFGIGAYISVLAVYVAFHWSGFGRLVIGAFALVPVLVVNCYRDIGIRSVALALLAPIALYFAQLSRYGSLSDSSDLFIGSAGHHMMVTHDALDGDFYRDFGVWNTFFSQYSLLFFNWVPRSWWPDKPIGAGYWSVDTIYGRAGYGEGYSHSIGFLGELYLYLGPDFWIGAVVVIVTLLLCRWIVARLSYGFVAPLVIFDVNIISYFWGGMATFGSRTWFMLIPAIATAWLFHRRHAFRGRRSTSQA